ncbi:hypothetical protein B0J14DRAFT_663942 [Halenospora varia]|nr:hypothetical protein B0J14DRAFT_663942 [Halenospora varia]
MSNSLSGSPSALTIGISINIISATLLSSQTCGYASSSFITKILGKKSDNADCATTYSTARGPWQSQQYFSLADHPQRVLNLPAVPTRLGCSSSSDMHIQICHPAGAKLCTTVPSQPNSYCAGGKVLFLQLAKPFSSADHRKRVSKQPRPMPTLRFFPSSRPWPWKLGFSLLVLCKSLFLPVTMCHPPGKRPTDLDTGRCLDAMPYPYRRR